MGCTTSHRNASSVGSNGLGSKSQDIDEAAMHAIKIQRYRLIIVWSNRAFSSHFPCCNNRLRIVEILRSNSQG